LKYLIDILNQIEDSYSIKLAIYGPIKDALYWEEFQKSIENSPPNVEISYKGEVESSKVNAILGGYHFVTRDSLARNSSNSLFY
jgi:hypothetical protein